MRRRLSRRSKSSTPQAWYGIGCIAKHCTRDSGCGQRQIDGRKVHAAGSLGLTPDCAITDIKHTDIIIIAAPGWDVLDDIAKNTPLVPWVKKWHDRGAYIAGACTGVAFLAESGILDGRVATTHWGVAEIFRKRYPNVRWQPDQFVTEDGRLFCSGGVYASIDLSLYLVEKFCGHEIALAGRQISASQHAPQAGSRDIRSSSFRAHIPTSRSGRPRNTCSNTSTVMSRSIALLNAPEWVRVTSSAVSRPRPGGCRAHTFKRYGYRRPRNCLNTAHRRSRRSPRKSDTRTSDSSGICSSVILA